MTWNTPLGHRKLAGIERKIMRSAICRLSREILEDTFEDSMNVGIAVFDSLTGCQQLVMLDSVRKFLFEDTAESNEMTAVIEGTAAAVIAYISGNIDLELDMDIEFRKSGPKMKPLRFWRKLILKAIQEYEWDLNPKTVPGDWELALEIFHDRILHDDDYEMDFADGPPESSDAVNLTLGIPNDYFTSIPLPEPDGPEMLEVIRRLLS
jgi:hypothetical protein